MYLHNCNFHGCGFVSPPFFRVVAVCVHEHIRDHIFCKLHYFLQMSYLSQGELICHHCYDVDKHMCILTDITGQYLAREAQDVTKIG